MKKLFTVFIFVSISFTFFGQDAIEKSAYIDTTLARTRTTYQQGNAAFNLGFDRLWDLANTDKTYKRDVVTYLDSTVRSVIHRDEKSRVTTLFIKLRSDYEVLLCINPFVGKAGSEKVEVSIFYISEGVIYNYPNKDSENSLSGVTRKLIPYKSGTAANLQEISLGKSDRVTLRDGIYLNSFKMANLPHNFEIKDGI
jgi:hypothetical protein